MASERVELTLDLDEDLLWKLFFMAHERDITLNELMNEIILRYTEDHEISASRAGDQEALDD